MTIFAPPENVIAVQSEVGFERTLESLRIELPRHEFRILEEVNFNRERDSVVGLATTPYAVLIVWHPFAAHQALLSDPYDVRRAQQPDEFRGERPEDGNKWLCTCRNTAHANKRQHNRAVTRCTRAAKMPQ